MVVRTLAVQLADLGAHLHAHLGVQVGQRLVEQERLGLAHDGAAHRHALALAAGQLAWACAPAWWMPRMSAPRSMRALDLRLGIQRRSRRPKAMFSYTLMCG
jgi:hypothetical protein